MVNHTRKCYKFVRQNVLVYHIIGNVQGKKQPQGILKGDYPHLLEPLGDRKRITINISRPNYPKRALGKCVNVGHLATNPPMIDDFCL